MSERRVRVASVEDLNPVQREFLRRGPDPKNKEEVACFARTFRDEFGFARVDWEVMRRWLTYVRRKERRDNGAGSVKDDSQKFARKVLSGRNLR